MISKLDVIKKRIVNPEELALLLVQLRLKSKKIVFTNGCFDLLHLGHVDYLSKAADFGDVLIVGVNSDASVKFLGKGANRPIQDEISRSILIASLHFVDFVLVFEEATPYELIKRIEPDVLVKGADYKVEEVAGYDLMQARGAEVKLIELLEGYSTSRIESKIRT